MQRQVTQGPFLKRKSVSLCLCLSFSPWNSFVPSSTNKGADTVISSGYHPRLKTLSLGPAVPSTFFKLTPSSSPRLKFLKNRSTNGLKKKCQWWNKEMLCWNLQIANTIFSVYKCTRKQGLEQRWPCNTIPSVHVRMCEWGGVLHDPNLCSGECSHASVFDHNFVGGQQHLKAWVAEWATRKELS